MRRSNCLGFPTFPTSLQRLGSRKALRRKGVPNLPNLPNLFLSRVYTCVGACRRAITHTHARALLTHTRLGRLGRLGRSPQDKAFRLPNLCPTSPRLGTPSEVCHGLP